MPILHLLLVISTLGLFFYFILRLNFKLFQGHFEGLQRQLNDLSEGVQTKLSENVHEGFKHFERVQQGLRQAEIQLQNLADVGSSIHELNNLLRLPHLRGGFGESTLERILGDMLPADAFEMQYQIPGTSNRVDAVIKCASYVIPIESKFPREQVLPLFEVSDPAKLEQARKTLFEVMRVLSKDVSEKYVRPDCGTSNMALLFIPSETLYFELLKHGKVTDEMAKHNVFAVSPNTLAVCVHSLSIAREYYRMAQGVEKTLTEVAKARQHLSGFEKRFDEVGQSLTKAQTAFGVATTHLSRFRSSVSRLVGDHPTADSLPPSEPTQLTVDQ